MFWLFSLHLRSIFSRPSPASTRGFGLVELMVSISIIGIVASIIMTRQNSFNGAVLLRSEAYQLAFQIREVQLSAVSASGDSGSFRDVVGVHFDTSNDDVYRIFRDANNNGFYNSGEEFGLQGILDDRFEIRAIRGIGDTISGSELSVIFVRPNFDGRFFDGPGATNELSATAVQIDIARRGVTGTGPEVLRTVEVSSTGQITVQ